MSLRNSVGADFVIAAINRKEKALVPSGHTVVLPGDILSVVADETDVTRILKNIGKRRSKPKRIILVGGSEIALFLLENFSCDARKNIVLVDQERAICIRFAQQFPEILVLNVDITDDRVLENEQLTGYDLLISLTDNDELNIITASYAKRSGIRCSMALIRQNSNYIRLARLMDIDSVISATEATVESLLRYLRGANIASIHSLFEGQLEVYEFRISETTSLCGHRVNEINMRNKGIIAGITGADGKNSIPAGTYRFTAGDTVVVIAVRESAEFIQSLFN
jgi:trk system potassium uptake protein TrkA